MVAPWHMRSPKISDSQRGSPIITAGEQVIFDASQQPGLASLTLQAASAIEIIQGWSDDVRAKLTALDIGSFGYHLNENLR